MLGELSNRVQVGQVDVVNGAMAATLEVLAFCAADYAVATGLCEDFGDNSFAYFLLLL